MDLSDSSWVADTEKWMTYLFSVITIPLGFQNNVIYTGTGLQAGGGLDGFAIWRHAVCSLGRSHGTLSRFKLFSSTSTACNENQHLPASETKDKYGKMGSRGGHSYAVERTLLQHKTNGCLYFPAKHHFTLNEWGFFFCFKLK